MAPEWVERDDPYNLTRHPTVRVVGEEDGLAQLGTTQPMQGFTISVKGTITVWG